MVSKELTVCGIPLLLIGWDNLASIINIINYHVMVFCSILLIASLLYSHDRTLEMKDLGISKISKTLTGLATPEKKTQVNLFFLWFYSQSPAFD